ncbi:alpha/beta hydrolase [Leucobacter chromiireducens]|uniref:alpha/beta hydrolase n=1 Tax=Leucobacter chromiireducens TaxID=283877 RepID=UPI000F63A7D1|nr:alpha/beta hydrolase [Leucobacter chromiireducens]
MTHTPVPRRRAAWRRLVLGGAALAAATALVGCSLLPGAGSGGAGGGSDPQLPDQPTGTVQGFAEQTPEWQPCANGMQCADVHAPLDWAEPAGETITLRLVKSAATGSEKLGTLFVNPGGPGASGAEYVANAVEHAVSADVRAAYDVIGWDPRGVGESAPVRCLDTAGMDEYLYGDDAETADLERGSDEWIAVARAQARDFAEACAERSGDILAHVATSDTVQDLDMLRGIVGDTKLNYLGFSYGTYIGARYADAYPERVGRLVLDGAMDPAATMQDVVREQTIGFENALRAYTSDCLQRRGCPLSGTVDAAMAQIGALLDRIDANSLTGADGRTVTSGVAVTAIVFPLYSQDMWGYLDQLFESLAVDDPEMALILADAYNDRQDGEYQSNSTEAFSAINCLDYPSDLDVARMRDDAAELAKIAPTIGRFQGFGDISCAEWPVAGVPERTPVRAAGADPILVVGTTGDPATPYRWAESLASQLESGSLITYVGEGHTAYTTSSCVGEVVDAYFLDGTVPAADPRCAA